jgi:hypothetical protein
MERIFSYEEKSKEIVETIRMLTLAGGSPPTQQQLGFIVGLGQQTLIKYLKRMRAEKLVDWEDGISRTLFVRTESNESE